MRHLISIPSSITWCFRRSAALVDMTMASTTSRPMCRTLADGTGTICSRCSQSFWVRSQCCREHKKPMVTMVYVRSSVLFPVFPVLWGDPRKESGHRNPTAVLSVVAVAGYRPAFVGVAWFPPGRSPWCGSFAARGRTVALAGRRGLTGHPPGRRFFRT